MIETFSHFQATDGWLEPQRNRLEDEGLTTSSLRLHLTLTPRLLKDGQAVVRCKSLIPGAYEKVSEELLMTSRPYQASVLDGATAGCSTSGVHMICIVALLPFQLLRWTVSRSNL
ncbi:hypothetical protein SK128_005278 [Halocaridina rubra]|uniref:Uncharacterized protein n=1 Tax=Halocaridina rubra TaxID=373956 RepID=A0AAN8WMF7_HALRR